MIKTSKIWVLLMIFISMTILFIVGITTAYIDPYFHFHKPLTNFKYPLYNERYQNNGIVKKFDYNAIITGSSMTENFKTSEFDKLFGVNSVKVSYAGATYKEINDNLLIATKYNKNIKIVLRGLDYNLLGTGKNKMRYLENMYPIYLYDDSLFNDIRYLLNKEAFMEGTLGVLERTNKGKNNTTFDEYMNWQKRHKFGKKAVDTIYKRPEKINNIKSISEIDYKNLDDNIKQNVTNLAKEHPEIEFYIFFTPYSIYYWDKINQKGMLERQLDMEEYAIKLMLEPNNVHLYSFFTEYDTVLNLDNYRDDGHYGENVNSQILLWIKEGRGKLTLDNYKEYIKEMKNFYMNFDYDSLFE